MTDIFSRGCGIHGNGQKEKKNVAIVCRMRSGDKHEEMPRKQKIFGLNKTCRQEFPQTFQVRSKHRECQPIQELGEKRKIKGFIYLL